MCICVREGLGEQVMWPYVAHSTPVREHLLQQENTFYSRRTPSTVREHLLQQENTFCSKYTSHEAAYLCVRTCTWLFLCVACNACNAYVYTYMYSLSSFVFVHARGYSCVFVLVHTCVYSQNMFCVTTHCG